MAAIQWLSSCVLLADERETERRRGGVSVMVRIWLEVARRGSDLQDHMAKVWLSRRSRLRGASQ